MPSLADLAEGLRSLLAEVRLFPMALSGDSSSSIGAGLALLGCNRYCFLRSRRHAGQQDYPQFSAGCCSESGTESVLPPLIVR
jgi:hypothetical protein